MHIVRHVYVHRFFINDKQKKVNRVACFIRFKINFLTSAPPKIDQRTIIFWAKKVDALLPGARRGVEEMSDSEMADAIN